MPQKTLVAILIGSLVLTGCGGGGGGSSSSPTPTAVSTGTTTPPDTPVTPVTPGVDPGPVPYYTPERAGSYTTTTAGSTATNISAMYAADLTADGVQEVVIAGRNTESNSAVQPYNLSVWGWRSGKFQDLSSKFFKTGENVIAGTEPSVHFGDFNGDSKRDIYIAPSIDNGNILHPELAFINSASGVFDRRTVGNANVYAHDAAVYDLNRDGRSDIVNTAMYFHFGNADGTFTTYPAASLIQGQGGVAVADFMGNGGSSIILTESIDAGGVNSNKANRLLDWGITNDVLTVNQIAELPTPRFLLPKWSSFNFGGAHDVRALAFDFDNSGLTDAVIFSRPRPVAGTYDWPKFSEVQFLLNKGSGVFQDVTDTTLIGYNHNTHVTYNPQLFDVNNDGLTDIVLSNPQWSAVEGVQVLVHTMEHKYVASYATVLQAFQNQSLNIEAALGSANATQGGNGVVFIKGPDNGLYVATGVDYTEAGTLQKAIYISKIGAEGAQLSAQATAGAIKQQWPWMSDSQVNQVLASASTNWLNLNLLDSAKALSMGPVGAIGVSVNGAWTPLSGSIGGVSLNGAARQFIISDSLSRTFSVDYSVANVNMAHFWSQSISDPIEDDTRGSVGQRFTNMQMTRMSVASAYNRIGYNQSVLGEGMFDEAVLKIGNNQMYNSINPYTGQAPVEAFTYGIANVKPFKDRNFAMNMQYSQLPFSPFIQMNGVWGKVNSADMVEASASYKFKTIIGKVGAINSYTSLQSGLVSNITPITSVWAEAGHEWKSGGVYFGMLPKVVAGEANINMPTGVDRRGNTAYTNINAGVNNPMIGYTRFQMVDFTDKKKTSRYGISGIYTTDNQKSIQASYTHRF